jgi:hypothetical protein
MVKAIGLILAAVTLASLPSGAADKNATCSLTIDGRARFSSQCTFKASKDIDYFSDGNLVITCPDGKRVEIASCYGYEQRIARKGTFGFLYRDGTTASVCWNEGSNTKAGTCYVGLRREGACWKSANAKNRHIDSWHSVNFCAYAL